jgi:hypothetical protein
MLWIRTSEVNDGVCDLVCVRVAVLDVQRLECTRKKCVTVNKHLLMQYGGAWILCRAWITHWPRTRLQWQCCLYAIRRDKTKVPISISTLTRSLCVNVKILLTMSHFILYARSIPPAPGIALTWYGFVCTTGLPDDTIVVMGAFAHDVLNRLGLFEASWLHMMHIQVHLSPDSL